MTDNELLAETIRNYLESGVDLLLTNDDYITIIKALEQEKIGHWIIDAETYYKAIKERGNIVDEYTPYFTDDIACSECLAKYSVLDNETQFFKHCPNCGAKMEG